MEKRLPQPEWDKFNPMRGQNNPPGSGRSPAPPRRRVPVASQRYSPYPQSQGGHSRPPNQYNLGYEGGGGGGGQFQCPEGRFQTRGQGQLQRGRGRGHFVPHSHNQYRGRGSRGGAGTGQIRYPTTTTGATNNAGPEGGDGVENANTPFGYKGQDGSGRPQPSFKKGGRRRNFKNRKNKNEFHHDEEASVVDGCVECESEEAHYKCPKCFQKYCSVACCQKHKDSSSCNLKDSKHDESCAEPGGQILESINGENSSNAKERQRVTYSFPTQDTIKPEGLMRLIKEEELREKLSDMLKSANLRDKIAALDKSQDPKHLMNSLVDDVEFSKFRTFVVETLNSCLFKG